MKKIYAWTIALVLLSFVMAGIFLAIAPDQIPAHYNLHGDVDRWGSKYEFTILPVMNLLFGSIMALIARFERKKGRDINEKVVLMMNVWVLALFNILWAFFMWKAVDFENLGSGIGQLPIKAFLMILSATFIPLGNILPKARRNAVLGLRTKWSMANDWCWQQSQRMGGYIMVSTGIVGVILSALLPVEWAGCALLILIVAMIIGCCIASYRIYRKGLNQ